MDISVPLTFLLLLGVKTLALGKSKNYRLLSNETNIFLLFYLIVVIYQKTLNFHNIVVYKFIKFQL